MPIAQLSERSSLNYHDTGPVLGSDKYTTVVLAHGMLSNQEIYSKCRSHGAEKNIRVITFNRHGYYGSSPFPSDVHKALLEGSDSFWHYLAQDTAQFLYWLVQNKGIPKSNARDSCGGFVLVGWSMAVATVLSVFAYKDAISADVRACLNDYLREVVIYDPPNTVLGKDIVDGYNPLTDEEIASPQERNLAFGAWVSSYWDHPDFTSHSPDGLDRVSKVGRNPTFEKMSVEELSSNFDQDGMLHADIALTFPTTAPVLNTQTGLALFNEEIAEELFPNIGIIWLAAASGPWIAASMYFSIKEEYEVRRRNGESLRPIQFHEIPGANHYLHWDEPSKFIDIISAMTGVPN